MLNKGPQQHQDMQGPRHQQGKKKLPASACTASWYYGQIETRSK